MTQTDLNIIPFTPDKAGEWDAFVATAPDGTILHSRQFLSYHGDRFTEASVMVYDAADTLVGVFPAAAVPNDPQTIASHPGATYGGLVASAKLPPLALADAITAICAHYRAMDMRSLIYKPAPAHISGPMAPALDWACHHAGAQVSRMDLWNIVDLNAPTYRSKGHKWAAKKAVKNGISIRSGTAADIDAFHALLADNLRDKYDTTPVHSADELRDLMVRFPQDIVLLLACDAQGGICGGTVLLHLNAQCSHTQYITSSPQGRADYALNLLIEDAIARSVARHARVFSFGASTDQGGQVLNAGLFAFKAGFGKASAVQRFLTFGL